MLTKKFELGITLASTSVPAVISFCGDTEDPLQFYNFRFGGNFFVRCLPCNWTDSVMADEIIIHVKPVAEADYVLVSTFQTDSYNVGVEQELQGYDPIISLTRFKPHLKQWAYLVRKNSIPEVVKFLEEAEKERRTKREKYIASVKASAEARPAALPGLQPIADKITFGEYGFRWEDVWYSYQDWEEAIKEAEAAEEADIEYEAEKTAFAAYVEENSATVQALFKQAENLGLYATADDWRFLVNIPDDVDSWGDTEYFCSIEDLSKFLQEYAEA